MPKEKMLTAAQVDRLRPYHKNMETAVKSDWERGLGRNGFQVLKEVLEEHTGKPYFLNLSCPVCRMGLVRTVGRLYFAALEKMEAEDAQKAAQKSASDTNAGEPAGNAGEKKKARKKAENN